MPIQIRTSLEEPDTGQNFVPHRSNRPEKSEGGKAFRLVSDYQPSGVLHDKRSQGGGGNNRPDAAGR